MFSRAMQGSSSIFEPQETRATALKIDGVELRLIRLPLLEPFETSFGKIDSRLIFLVCLQAGGLQGWGEVVASEEPLYSYETVRTALHVIEDFFGPALLTEPIQDLDDLARRLSPFRGHNMAKAGLELAYMDLLARMNQQSLSTLIGGERERVAVGVSLGIQPTLSKLLQRVEKYLSLGYQRIKLKIKPGWDIDVVDEVRRRHPDILLSVDANSAYTLEDRDHLKKLDDFDLLMIEQPLQNDDLVDHARLQKLMNTPLCLDESIISERHARMALDLESCRIINIKVGRVGGYSQVLGIHDLCVSRQVPVWCGGMLESGIGRAHNIALASLKGFTLPGDISASSRYFERDIITPGVVVDGDGTVAVPGGPGLGFEVDLNFIERRTETRVHISR
ncbi:MAG TPA: o-succinylbenzoate synthase [Pyrinomonadaceae bacterium]|nr:o-succinylbenzoate synthase [Pyrinomonadaceae bacterium]